MDVSLERTTYARSLSLLSFFNWYMSTETKQGRYLSKKCISWCVALASLSDIVENLKEHNDKTVNSGSFKVYRGSYNALNKYLCCLYR